MTDDANRRWKDALQARLDDELTAAERAAFEAELAADPGRAGEAAEFDRLARLARNARITAPADLAARVMESIAADEAPLEPAARRYNPPPEPGLLARLLGVGAGGFRPAFAGALALAAVAVAITLLITRFQSTPAPVPGPEPRPMAGNIEPEDASSTTDVVVHRFVLEAPNARKVCLVGDFNEWKLCEVPMLKDTATGRWVAEVRLPKGRHQYMFVVDDQDWQTDPHADVRVDDGFGNQNAVVFL